MSCMYVCVYVCMSMSVVVLRGISMRVQLIVTSSAAGIERPIPLGVRVTDAESQSR